MEVSQSLKQLAKLTEQFEAAETKVVELTPHSDDLLTEGGYTIDLAVAIPVFETAEEESAFTVSATETIISDEGILVNLTAQVEDKQKPEERVPHQIEDRSDLLPNRKTDGGTRDSRGVESSLADETKSTEAGERPQRETPKQATNDEHGPDVDGEQDTDDDEKPTRPPYKDPEELQAVYDPELTFAEMRDALDVDVTPETVRNHMIEHGIHQPDSRREPEDGDVEKSFPGKIEDGSLDAGETAVAITDAVELPQNVTLSEVTEAVQTAQTLYDVQRELGLDREQVRHLLRELNLLELVHGRISTATSRSKSQEAIEERIREAITDGVAAK